MLLKENEQPTQQLDTLHRYAKEFVRSFVSTFSVKYFMLT